MVDWDQVVRERGFRDEAELHELSNAADLSNPDVVGEYQRWAAGSADKAGLLRVIDYPRIKAEEEAERVRKEEEAKKMAAMQRAAVTINNGYGNGVVINNTSWSSSTGTGSGYGYVTLSGPITYSR
jgi:hypothetical protein